RTGDEVQAWLARDPITRLEAHLRTAGRLDDAAIDALAAEAEQLAATLRERMNAETEPDPAGLFTHVYSRPTAALEQQRRDLLAGFEDE
ncbi:MAG TPA: pyruvate dehydrogenase (acetyl-transferring) E1 component subunit alpha, partial [Streptosporangiaceae bacterium]|nr:pyruvate dehydrogenase (acetyl-transferring) E1 component subunit alpha [Streptosporangiaceae bacterium]